MRRGAMTGVTVVLAGLLGSIVASGAPQPAAPVVQVFKDPTCGCCGKWIEHLKANGFTVRVSQTADLKPLKAAHHVPAALQSCHTALAGNYVIEGHVPAREVRKLLSDHPAVAGLAVAGMPYGSPGMEVGDVKHPYNVMAFDTQGRTRVFASYGK